MCTSGVARWGGREICDTPAGGVIQTATQMDPTGAPRPLEPLPEPKLPRFDPKFELTQAHHKHEVRRLRVSVLNYMGGMLLGKLSSPNA